MRSPRIVVLGAAGMLGHKMFQRLSERFPEAWCTLREDPTSQPFRRIPMLQAPHAIPGVDITDFPRLEGTLRALRPDYVVNCVGIIKQRDGYFCPTPRKGKIGGVRRAGWCRPFSFPCLGCHLD